MEEQLQNIEEFFKLDIKIKNILLDLAPKESDSYDVEAKMKYIDTLVEELKYINGVLDKIVQDFKIPIEDDCITLLFNELYKQIYNFNYNTGSLQRLYEKVFTAMDEKLVSEVSETCVGYTILNLSTELVNKCKTINEILHVFHSYIVNNETIYQSMPKLCAPKVNEEGYDINLYGIETDLAKKIFDEFPLDISCGYTDIVSLKDRILMMIRNRGHALTIELLDNGNGTISVNYFIPKVCNVDMVNKLKGVTKVSKESKFTRGMFDTSKEEITGELFKFIEGVPMDSDIPDRTDEVIKMLQEQEKIKKRALEDKKPKIKEVHIIEEDMFELTKQRRISRITEIYMNLIAELRGKENTNEQTRDE